MTHMARLRNVQTNVTVSVADEKVSRFGPEWVPVDEKRAPKPRTSKK